MGLPGRFDVAPERLELIVADRRAWRTWLSEYRRRPFRRTPPGLWEVVDPIGVVGKRVVGMDRPGVEG